MSTPDVSVIVPVYNAAEYLDGCISSILASTYADFELILVDDGSTDASGDVCDAYADMDSRVRVVHTVNMGVSAARNTGIDAARGAFLTFVDADDIVAPEMIGRLRSTINADTPASVVNVTMTEQKLSMHAPSTKQMTLPGTTAAARLLHQKNFLYNTIPGGKMFARRLFDHLRFSPGRFEDLDIVPRLFVKAGCVAYDRSYLYFYRQHPAAFSHVVSPARLDALTVTANLEAWAAGVSPEVYRAARDRRFSAAFNVFNIITAHLLPDAPADTVDTCWEIIRERRREVLLSSNPRLKNRLGALISYLGPRFTRRVARLSK